MFQVVCLNYSIMNSRCFSQIVTSLICLESSGINLKDDSVHRARNPGNKLGNNSIYNVKDQF